MHLVRRGHFPSRDKDGGNTIGFAMPKNPIYATREPHGAIFYRTGVMGDRSFNLFCPCDSMTFIYERDVEIHWMCKYELLTSRLSRFIV